jgi:glycosyltransferase involved in cell wall biosynthesis
LYRLGLKLADTVIAQTKTQQRLLEQEMGLSTVLIPNCGWDLPSDSLREPPVAGSPSSYRVLWIGRFSKQKRLEWLLDVAERCPEIMFDVVGAPGSHSDYASYLIERGARLANVEMHGYVPYAEMEKYYQCCHVLCCTSAYEGFPNIFLEAWSHGVPVVSTFDPDGVIAANGLGWVTHGIDDTSACLTQVTGCPTNWRAASTAARQYVMANHAPGVCLPQFEHVLADLMGRSTRKQRG